MKKKTWFSGILKNELQGAWLTHLEEHATLDIGVMSSSPMLGVEVGREREREGEKLKELIIQTAYKLC